MAAPFRLCRAAPASFESRVNNQDYFSNWENIYAATFYTAKSALYWNVAASNCLSHVSHISQRFMNVVSAAGLQVVRQEFWLKRMPLSNTVDRESGRYGASRRMR
jgi:hypothetical protein